MLESVKQIYCKVFPNVWVTRTDGPPNVHPMVFLGMPQVESTCSESTAARHELLANSKQQQQQQQQQQEGQPQQQGQPQLNYIEPPETGKGNAAAKALKRWHQTQFVTPTWEYNGQAHEYYAYELRCVQYILHCIHMYLYPHVSNVSTHLGQRCIINGIIESAMQLYLFVCMCFRSFQVTHSNLTPRRQSFHRQAEIRKWSGEGIQISPLRNQFEPLGTREDSELNFIEINEDVLKFYQIWLIEIYVANRCPCLSYHFPRQVNLRNRPDGVPADDPSNFQAASLQHLYQWFTNVIPCVDTIISIIISIIIADELSFLMIIACLSCAYH